MKRLAAALLLGGVGTLAACSSAPQIEPFGGEIVVSLRDGSPQTRAAVEDACGHLPGVVRVFAKPDQPDTLRFDIPPASEDKKHVRPAIWDCIHHQPQVLRAAEPL